ncbi:hypothetical protein CDD83_6716 [Cordyceps sp. RAO-2017]|nr:hypothetical protein CDD83_6716 [Cordyceps sp. RAO-2017]
MPIPAALPDASCFFSARRRRPYQPSRGHDQSAQRGQAEDTQEGERLGRLQLGRDATAPSQVFAISSSSSPDRPIRPPAARTAEPAAQSHPSAETVHSCRPSPLRRSLPVSVARAVAGGPLPRLEPAHRESVYLKRTKRNK